MALALDEPTDQDKTFEAHGFTFCINESLLTQVQSIKIDMTYMGFVVEPGVPLSGGGSGCGSCGSGGGCSSAH